MKKLEKLLSTKILNSNEQKSISGGIWYFCPDGNYYTVPCEKDKTWGTDD